MCYIDVYIEDDRTKEDDNDIVITKEKHHYQLNTEHGSVYNTLACFAKIMMDAGYPYVGVMNAFKELAKASNSSELLDYCYPV